MNRKDFFKLLGVGALTTSLTKAQPNEQVYSGIPGLDNKTQWRYTRNRITDEEINRLEHPVKPEECFNPIKHVRYDMTGCRTNQVTGKNEVKLVNVTPSGQRHTFWMEIENKKESFEFLRSIIS